MSVLDNSIDKIMGVLNRKSTDGLPSIHMPPAAQQLKAVRESRNEESMLGMDGDTRYLSDLT